MDRRDIDKAVAKYNAESKNVFIAVGGDGTLLQAVRDNPKKVILPLRNYGNCDCHKLEDIVDDLVNSPKKSKSLPAEIKIDVMPRLRYMRRGANDEPIDSLPALAEIAFKSTDITSAVRFDVYVNGHLYLENVIADGLVAATPLGSHGYFKSIARTMFYEGIGIAFIAPTYGICNLVLKSSDNVIVRFRRDVEVNLSSDKTVETVKFKDGDCLTISDACDNVSIAGYSIFMCSDCRKNRNSTVINDQYFVGCTPDYSKKEDL